MPLEIYLAENKLLPEYSAGRVFFSPVLGCLGGCQYCYICLRGFTTPHINTCKLNDVLQSIYNIPEFIKGEKGTIISIGAWGDIFGGNPVLEGHSTSIIKRLLEIGNPLQIMSKYVLSKESIIAICNSIQYKNQLLYSTTITSITSAHILEPQVPPPVERLKTCTLFAENNVATNVLIKPYLPGITNLDTEVIAELLCDYDIDYCVVGIMYCDDQILSRICGISPFAITTCSNTFKNHLDCAEEIRLESYATNELDIFVAALQSRGVKVFKKSSCVNSNMLKKFNLTLQL